MKIPAKPKHNKLPNKKPLSRNKTLEQMREKINRESYPRLEMIFLVSFTGLAGFLSSYWLFKFGFTTMWTRYLLSIGVSYITFIILLKIWLWCKTTNSSSNSNSDSVGEIFDIPIMSGNSPSNANTLPGNINNFKGGGGSFDGGGASGDFDSSGSGAFGEAIESVAEAEEAAIPLIVIITLLFGLLSSIIFVFTLVNSAPMLFAELLVDGVLSASLYRRLKGIDRYHWLESAIKRTIWPFVWIAITFVIVGIVIQSFMPNVHSIGEVIDLLSKIK